MKRKTIIYLLGISLFYSNLFSQSFNENTENLEVVLSKKYSGNSDKDNTPIIKLLFSKYGVLIKKVTYEGWLDNFKWFANKFSTSEIHYIYEQDKLKESREYLTGYLQGMFYRSKTTYTYDDKNRLLQKSYFTSKTDSLWHKKKDKDSLKYVIKYEYDIENNEKEIGTYYYQVKKNDSLQRVTSSKYITVHNDTITWTYKYIKNKKIGYLKNNSVNYDFSLVQTTNFNSNKTINEINYIYDIKNSDKKKVTKLKNKKISYYKNELIKRIEFHIPDRDNSKPSYIIDIQYNLKLKKGEVIPHKINKEIIELIKNY